MDWCANCEKTIDQPDMYDEDDEMFRCCPYCDSDWLMNVYMPVKAPKEEE